MKLIKRHPQNVWQMATVRTQIRKGKHSPNVEKKNETVIRGGGEVESQKSLGSGGGEGKNHSRVL